MSSTSRLIFIKLVHTVVWAFFAGCICAIPILTYLRRLDHAGFLIVVVLLECLVLVLNRLSCPLTAVAARYTDDRRENFDIYLPLWIARYNKQIFGTLYAAGSIYTLVSWLTGTETS